MFSQSDGQLVHPIFWISGAAQTAAEITFGTTAMLSLIYCIYVAVREKSYWPLGVYIASCLQIWALEPYNNLLAYCAYPAVGNPITDAGNVWAHQHTYVSMLGRHIPLYTQFIYMTYFSAPVVALVRYFQSGITLQQYWRIFWIAALICTLFEPGFIQMKWWMYYGDNQPLELLGFPFYWWIANPMCVIVTAGLYHLLRRYRLLGGWENLAYIGLGPLFVFASWMSSAVPAYIALDLTRDRLWTNLAALLVVVTSLFYTAAIGAAITKPSPAPAV